MKKEIRKKLRLSAETLGLLDLKQATAGRFNGEDVLFREDRLLADRFRARGGAKGTPLPAFDSGMPTC